MKLTNVLTNTKTAIVHFENTEDTLTLVYAPTHITPNTMASFARLADLSDTEQVAALVRLTHDIIRKWDLAEDTPEDLTGDALATYQASGPHYIPLTIAGIGSVPIDVLNVIIEGVFADLKGNPQNGSALSPSSAAPSLNQAS